MPEIGLSLLLECTYTNLDLRHNTFHPLIFFFLNMLRSKSGPNTRCVFHASNSVYSGERTDPTVRHPNLSHGLRRVVCSSSCPSLGPHPTLKQWRWQVRDTEMTQGLHTPLSRGAGGSGSITCTRIIVPSCRTWRNNEEWRSRGSRKCSRRRRRQSRASAGERREVDFSVEKSVLL